MRRCAPRSKNAATIIPEDRLSNLMNFDSNGAMMGTREEGYYWIAGYNDHPEIARWDGLFWWFIGSDNEERYEDRVAVLSDRINPPAH